MQLGLFARRDNAERLTHAAVAKGFTVGIAGPDARGLYRVHATGLADRAAAQGLSAAAAGPGLCGQHRRAAVRSGLQPKREPRHSEICGTSDAPTRG